MRAIEANQEELSKESSLATIALVKITTYSDRDALTEGDVFYLSDRSLWYKYGTGSAIRFDPWLLSLGDLSTEMTHMQSAAAGELISKSFSLTLRNMLWPADASGDRVIELLRASYPLEMATVEVSQLLVPRYFGYYPQELSDYAGTEHTVFYRGKVSRVGPTTGESIQIQCTTDSPEIVSGRCEDPSTAAPRDLGTRYPRPYGQVKKLPLPGHTVGWTTTWAESINETDTGVKQVTDSTGFPPSGTFYVQAEGEKITCTASGANGITISARGAQASPHNAGTAVAELPTEAIFIVADDGAAPINSINDVYVRNPFNGKLVRLGSNSYAFEASDTGVDSGKTLSTITFSQAQLESLYSDLFLSARVSVQPVYRTGGSGPTTVVEEPAGTGFGESPPGNVKNGDWTDPTAADPYFNAGFEDPDEQCVKPFDSSPDNTKNVLRWRLKITVEADGEYDGAQAYMRMDSPSSNFFPTEYVDVAIPKTHTTQATAYGDWHEPAAGTKLYDLRNDKLVMWCHPPLSPYPECYVRVYGVEADLEESSDITQDVDAAITAAGFGYDLEVFADVEGAVAPNPVVNEYSGVYSFDDDTSWNEDDGVTRSTNTSVEYEGTGCQELVLHGDKILRCEVADGSEAAQWSPGFNTIADEGTIKTEGSSGLKGSSTSTSLASQLSIEFSPTVDLTAGDGLLILLDVRIHRNGASEDVVRVEIGDGVADHNDYEFDMADFPDDTWKTIVVDYQETPDEVAGNPDFSAFDVIYVVWNDGITQVTGFELYLDNIRTIQRSEFVQKNDVASIDMSGAAPVYQFALRVDTEAKNIVDSVRVYLDNTAGSGTTPPSPTSYVQIDSADFGAADAWELTATSSVPSGDENAVQTVGIRVTYGLSHGVYALISDSVTLYIDALQVATALGAAYQATAGSMMEHPADLFLHWCAEIGGVSVDETSLAAAVTNLGSNILAVDMRTLTPGDWKQGLAGLGFLSRANMIPEETAAGTVYKMLTAESDYDFPAADEALTVWKEFSEAGPLEREVWTRFTCFYAFNAATQIGNEESYEGFLRADEDSSDLSAPLDTTGLAVVVGKYGNMAAAPIFLAGINDEATAKDIFGWPVHEFTRAPRIFLFEGCAWWEVYRWEVGDVKKFTHPWSGVEVKFRILSCDKVFRTEANTLRCLEVE